MVRFKMPLINNAEARALTKASDIQASLVRQLPSSVLWEDSVKAMARWCDNVRRGWAGNGIERLDQTDSAGRGDPECQ